jgi:hypothetical protein
MLDSDFWRNLAEQFRALDPGGLVRADWHYNIKVATQAPDIAKWRLVGPRTFTRSIELDFEALARRAGPRVHRKMESFVSWMEALRESRLNTEDREGVGIESNPEGVVIARGYFGTVSHVCQASADLCRHYESLALETERMAELQRESQTMTEQEQAHQIAVEAYISAQHSDISDTEPAEAANPVGVTGRLNREERLQDFIAKNQTSIAAVSQAARVFKPQMQQWRHEQLGDTSVMSERIEKVLSGETPLLDTRGKKRG